MERIFRDGRGSGGLDVAYDVPADRKFLMKRLVGLVLVLAALIIPGGLLALMAAAVVRAVARSRTGRRAWVRMAGFWRRTVSPLETVPKAA